MFISPKWSVWRPPGLLQWFRCQSSHIASNFNSPSWPAIRIFSSFRISVSRSISPVLRSAPGWREDSLKRTFMQLMIARIIYLSSICFCSPGRARTCDKSINSRLLYQLSYRGMWRDNSKMDTIWKVCVYMCILYV